MVVCNREGCAFKSASNLCSKDILILNHGLCAEWFTKDLQMRQQPLYQIQPTQEIKEENNKDQVD